MRTSFWPFDLRLGQLVLLYLARFPVSNRGSEPIPHPQRGGLSYLSAELCMRAGFFPKAARVMSRKTTQLQLIQAGFGIALTGRSSGARASALTYGETVSVKLGTQLITPRVRR